MDPGFFNIFFQLLVSMILLGFVSRRCWKDVAGGRSCVSGSALSGSISRILQRGQLLQCLSCNGFVVEWPQVDISLWTALLTSPKDGFSASSTGLALQQFLCHTVDPQLCPSQQGLDQDLDLSSGRGWGVASSLGPPGLVLLSIIYYFSIYRVLFTSY